MRATISPPSKITADKTSSYLHLFSLPHRFFSSFHAFNLNPQIPSLSTSSIIISCSSITRTMQQYSQYLMWTKKCKHVLNLHFQATMNPFSFSHSWEEQAFADDAAGALGGFVWPPRSYSCSFCKREFRSAQALGGHMNVHRRDKARLKQYLGTPQNQDLPSPNSPSSVSAISTLENFSGRTHVSPFSSSSSSVVQEQRKNGQKEESGFLGDDGCVETNLSMGLKLVVSRNNQPSGFDDDESNITRKKHKIVVSDEISPFYSEILGLKAGSLMEELDLELRLGDPPKVK